MNKIEKTPEKVPAAGKPGGKNGGNPVATTPVPAEPAKAEGMTINPANHCIITYRDPDSPVAEEYRKLKTVLLRMTREEFKNTVMVTSSISGEGKSVTSANLAVMLAREYGQTVLLIDADLRRPSLDEYLGIAPLYGLADCLEDRMDPGKAIVKTDTETILHVGRKKSGKSGELLSSHQMKGFLLS
jgi:Mrp family chromosome partitioning ATPase